MWCIGALTDEYRQRMYALLDLYARPLSQAEPVICINEKSLQLIGYIEYMTNELAAHWSYTLYNHPLINSGSNSICLDSRCSHVIKEKYEKIFSIEPICPISCLRRGERINHFNCFNHLDRYRRRRHGGADGWRYYQSH
jgi:hypothetical protein